LIFAIGSEIHGINEYYKNHKEIIKIRNASKSESQCRKSSRSSLILGLNRRVRLGSNRKNPLDEMDLENYQVRMTGLMATGLRREHMHDVQRAAPEELPGLYARESKSKQLPAHTASPHSAGHL
jgi:hypothetical protein